MAFVPLEKLMFLGPGYRGEFVVNHVPLLLIQVDDTPVLIRNQCPHRQHPLSEGSLQEGRIRCAKHGWSFDLTTGACAFPAPGPYLTFYPVVYDGNRIGVDDQFIPIS